MPGCTDRQHQAVECGERVLNPGAQHRVAEQTHQVVRLYGEAQCRFGRPEIPQVESIQAKVGLQFLDPVLTVCPAPVCA